MTRFSALIFFLVITKAFSLSVLNFVKSESKETDDICAVHKEAYFNGIQTGEDWALESKKKKVSIKQYTYFKVFDANGKIPSGILRGANFELGSYDQCQDISTTVADEALRGKYCFAGLIIPYEMLLNSSELSVNFEADVEKDLIQRNVKTALGQQITRSLQPRLDLPNILDVEGVLLVSSCIPDKCMPSEVFGQLGLDFNCETKGETRQLDSLDTSCLVFLGVVITLMIISTTYDVYLHYSSKDTAYPVLLAFSIYTNSKKVFQTTDFNASNQILCFHGIKTLSMLWVISGHATAIKSVAVFSMDPKNAIEWQKRWYSVYITQAPLAVDSFLFMSGALLSYNFLKTMGKSGAKFNILLFYVHRYLRLTPALAALYFVVVSIARRIGDGPAFILSAENQKGYCDDKPWSFFLYIQNYVKSASDICLQQTWYLSVDMQLYIISPLILLILWKYPRPSKQYGLPSLLFLSILFSFLMNSFYKGETNQYHTHHKFTQWLIGISTGIILLKAQNTTFRIGKKTSLLIWCLTLIVMSVIIFASNDITYNPNKWKSVFFNSFTTIGWGTCLGWICFACVTGRGGFVNWFLSNSFFQVMGKLTYSIYLVHMTTLTSIYTQRRYKVNVEDFQIIFDIFGITVVCVFIGFFWVLAFESPMIALEKFLLGGGMKSKPQQRKALEEPNLEVVNSKRNTSE